MSDVFEPTPTPLVEDVATMVKTETPTSHGMMWAISSPTGGVLALVRDEAAADLVLTALAAYVAPPPPEVVRDAGWMSVEDITRRTEEAQDALRRAGQMCLFPTPEQRPIEPDYPPTSSYPAQPNLL
jgi:hypothetical protein